MKKIETIQIAELSTVTGGFWNVNFDKGPLRRHNGPITDSFVGAFYCDKDVGAGFGNDPICVGKKRNRFE